MSQTPQSPTDPTQDAAKPGEAKSPATTIVTGVLLVLVVGLATAVILIKLKPDKPEPVIESSPRAAPSTREPASTQPSEAEMRITIQARLSLMKSMQALMAEYQASATDFNMAGGFDPRSLETEKELAGRMEKLDRWSKASAAMADFYSHLDKHATQAALDAGATEEHAKDFAKQMAVALHVRIVSQIHAAERSLINAEHEKLQILRDRWGAWEVVKTTTVPATQPTTEPATQPITEATTQPTTRPAVIFEEGNDEFARRYNLAHDRAVKAAELRNHLQSKLVAELEAKLNGDAGDQPARVDE